MKRSIMSIFINPMKKPQLNNKIMICFFSVVNLLIDFNQS
jgi:hypothetical protein